MIEWLDKAKRQRKTTASDHYVWELYRKGLDAQRKQLHDYWSNAAFLAGDQHIYINRETKRLDHIPDDGRIHPTINVLWPNSRTIMSKLTQRELQFEVPPNSADDVAIAGSQISESILSAVHREHGWEALRESCAWSVWKGGTAAICVDWDPNRGKPTALADDGRLLPSGDTVETALSPAEFVIQPGARVAETAEWWIKAQALPPSEVQSTYGLDEEPDADATFGLSPLGKRLMASQLSGSHGPGDKNQSTPLTLVLTYYRRPMMKKGKKDKGKICTIVNGEEVFEGDWPFPFVDWLNIATCRETVIENTWAGTTALSAARPVQAAFNNAWGNILEHADVAGNARLMMPQSALELAEQWTDIPGEQVPFVDGMGQPSWLTPPQLPGWLLQMPGELRAEIDNITGVHDISRGSTPANIESGYGLAVLAEQDATPIGKLAKSMAEMWSRVASMVLKLYEAEVEETRTAVIEIPGSPPETQSWSGKDIAGQTTAVVPLDLVLPRSRAAMMQLAEKMVQMGQITTIEEFTRVAELPGERDLISAARPDVDRARRENHSMALGRVEFPEGWDDHEIHIHEHNIFRKSARYARLPDEVKSIFADHIQGHETEAAEAAAKMQMRSTVGGEALGMVPSANEDPAAPPVDPGELPESEVIPPEELTVLDQLSGDEVAAQARLDAESASLGAAETQQDIEAQAILELMQTQQGR